ncbi:MAG TPA: PAS domain-containing protein [Chitinophagaceae bacterium]|jgi:PAS domain S-box-containing protein|nr:PAS domain-containing protein [Chitinophagaceae bacterium]
MNKSASLEEQLANSRVREKDLQVRVEDLEDFIENASIPLHWVNGSGIITWANQVELDLLGYGKEEYIGKHISNFHADKNVCEDILTRLIRKETLYNYPAMLVAKNKKYIPVLINSNVRWDGDKFLHTRCFTRDISDLKKIENDKVSLINELQEQNSALKAELRSLKNELTASRRNA